MAKSSTSINLVKTHVGLVDQIIKWALSVGRVVVVIVEFIALATFLYRFSLDRQLIDLRTKIKQEQAVVNFLKDRELKYRNLQERLTLSSAFAKENDERMDITKDILSFAPADMAINSFSISKEGVRLSVDIGSISSLTNFSDKLKNYPKITSVSIEKIENRPSDGVITVTINAGFKKEGENESKSQ